MKKNDDLNFDEVIFDEAAQAKDLERVELPLARKAFLLVAFGVLILGGIIALRVGYLNIVIGDFYNQRSAANVNKEITVPAERGIIMDRYGQILAKNTAALSVFVDASELLKMGNEGELDSAADKLSKILTAGKEDIKQFILETDLEKTRWISIARNILPEEGIAIRGLNLLYIKLVNDYIREYPDGAIFAHVLGYTGLSEKGNEIVGKTGLEAYYDSSVRGQSGAQVLYKDAVGTVIDEKIVREAKPGQELKTTIDAELQRYFYRRLNEGLRALGRDAGVGLAINPQNGEILSLISLPSFDNNLFVLRGRNQEKATLLNSPSKPLFNRSVSGNYNPGSTIKPLVALAALKENIVTPEFQIFSAGFIEIPNPYNPEKPSRFVDWKPHGWVDIHSALARSSNVYFYTIGGGFEKTKGLGINKLKEYWAKLGFGRKTDVDLGGENTGFLPDPEEKEKQTGDIWRIGDTYNVSIGQGDLLVTPLQLINFIASLANGGKVYKPRLLKSEKAPEVLIDYSSWQKEIKEVQKGMEDAVGKYYGTANMLSSLPFKSAGKTGSAQVANNTRTNAFFVGYEPAENPQIAILVLIENAREGSLNAVPIAKDVLEWYYYNRIMN